VPVARRRLAAAPLAILAVVTGLVLAVGGGASPAGAHATLQRTQPADDAVVDAVPEAISLSFDEEVDAAPGAIQVIAPDGRRVDGSVGDLDGHRGFSVGVEGEARGTYTVAYRIVSDDGHTISGSFVFHVGERTGAAVIDQSIPATTSALGGVGRWLGYAGAAVAVGAALLLALLRRSAPAGGAAGAGRSPGAAAVGRLGSLIVAGAAASALGTAAAVLAQVARTTGRSPVDALALVGDVATDSRPVGFAGLRAALLVGALLVGVVGRARHRPLALVASGAVVAAAGLLAPVAGHPWTADPRQVSLTADALHLTAASVWLGMLAALLVAVPVLVDPDRAVRLVSGSAVVAAAVVAASGTVSAWLLLGSVDALTETASGQLVILKVIGFAAIVALGWINRSRLVPLLHRAAATPAEAGAAEAAPAGTGPAETARRRLLQLVRAEVVVGALVLAVTAGLVNQPPGRDTLAQPYAEVRTVEELRMRLEVEPARAGDNTLHVYLTDTAGRPVRFDALEVKVSREGIPERKLDGVTPINPDHASVYGASLPTPGAWTVAVTTVTLTTSATFSFEVPVR